MHIGLFVQENTSLTSLPMKTYLTCGLFPTWVREKQLVAQLTLSHMKFPLGLLVPLHPSGRPLIPSRGITFPHTFSCIFLLVAGPGNAWVTGLEVLGHVSSPAGWWAHVKLKLGPSLVIQVGPLRSTCLNTHCAHILQHLPPFLCFEVSAVFLCYSKGYTGCLVFHPYCKPVKRLQPCCCRHGEQWGAWTDAIITSDTEGLPPPSTLLTGGRVCLPLRQYGGHCQILLGYNSFFFFSLLSSMACKNAFKRLNMILHSPNWLHFSIFSICNKSLLFSLCLQRRWN